jgi:hypothetical protein
LGKFFLNASKIMAKGSISDTSDDSTANILIQKSST